MGHRNTMSRRNKNSIHSFRIDKAIVFVISILLLMSVFSIYALAYSETQGSTQSDGSVAPVIAADNLNQGAADVSLTDAGPMQTDATYTVANNSNLVLNKTSTLNDDGTVTINLNAYAIGQLVTSSVPADIVLVLDQSGSMDNSFGQRYVAAYSIPAASKSGQNGTSYYVNINGTYLRVYTAKTGNKWYYYVNNGSNVTVVPKTSANDTDTSHVQFYNSQDITNLDALKEAVNTFVSTVQNNAQQNNINHRIAIVGFANGGPGTGDYSSVGGNYYNTEMLSGIGTPIRYDNISNSNYTNALQSMDTSSGRANIASAINMLDAQGATYTSLGLTMARNIFAYNPIPEGQTRNRIVVMFTDGAPGYSGYTTSVANDAIAASKTIKDSGTTVYTVGVFSGANPSETGNNANGFMNYSSSNYPNATSVTNTGSRVSSDYNYYLTANDPSALNDIFENISSIIGDNVEGAVIKDSVKPQFYIPTPVSCTVTPSKYQSGVSVEQKPDGTYTLDVSGVTLDPVVLDENGNVAPGYEDRVVHTTFTIKPNEDFIGGNQVLTNKDDSGVYTSDLSEMIGSFEMPTVDLPISFIPVTNDKSIYVGDSIDALSLIKTNTNGAPVYHKAGLSTQYSINGINNSYVDIYYQIKQGATVIATYKVAAGTLTPVLLDANGNPVTDNSKVTINPLSNALYTVTATAMPTNTGTSVASNSMVNANVYVFKPSLVCTDTSIYLSNTADLNARVGNISWSCGTSGISNPEGAVPSLSYTFVSEGTGNEISNISQYVPIGVDFENINIASVKRTDINLSLSQGQYTITPAHENDTHNFTIYMYRPNITLKDLSIFFGDTVDLNTAIVNGINWQCTQIAPSVEGTVPNLIINFTTKRGSNIGENYTAFRPKDYTDVNIDVLVQKQTGNVSIKDFCNITKAVGQLDDHDFTVNLAKGSLTINKTGSNVEDDQSFLFAIQYTDFNGNPALIYEVIQGTGSKTITGLVAGNYTVKEQTNWSWRYIPDNATKSVTISSSNSHAEVGFENTYANDKWLSSNSFAINIFKSLGASN